MAISCVNCGAEAKILIRRSGSDTTALSFCPSCARTRGISAENGSIELSIDLLVAEHESRVATLRSCPSCGLDLARLLRKKRLGCSACPDTFRENIRALRATHRTDGPGMDGRPALDGGPAVLRSYARIGRNFNGLNFTDSATSSEPLAARGVALLEGSGFILSDLSSLQSELRDDMLQKGRFPPQWLAQPRSIVAIDPTSSAFLCLGAEDHLSLVDSREGLAVVPLEGELQNIARRLEARFEPACDEEFGYICSYIYDCGRGIHSSVLLHLPALARSGILERILRGLLSEGWSMEGFYGGDEGSAGDLWMLEYKDGEMNGASIEEAALRVAYAEETARKELARNSMAELHDLGGRALGTLSFARRMTLSEAMSLASDLRLSILVGVFQGIEERRVARLLAKLVAQGRSEFLPGLALKPANRKETREESRADQLRRELGIRAFAEGYALPLSLEGVR